MRLGAADLPTTRFHLSVRTIHRRSKQRHCNRWAQAVSIPDIMIHDTAVLHCTPLHVSLKTLRNVITTPSTMAVTWHPADTHCLCNKAIMLSHTIKETPCNMWTLTETVNYAIKINTHRSVRPILTVTVRNGTSDLLKVQYQVANVPASTISPKAETKNSPQNIPNILNAWR